MRPTALKQLPLSNPRYPFRPCKVTFGGATRTTGMVLGVDAQNDPAHLLPVGAIRFGIKAARDRGRQFGLRALPRYR